MKNLLWPLACLLLSGVCSADDGFEFKMPSMNLHQDKMFKVQDVPKLETWSNPEIDILKDRMDRIEKKLDDLLAVKTAAAPGCQCGDDCPCLTRAKAEAPKTKTVTRYRLEEVCGPDGCYLQRVPYEVEVPLESTEVETGSTLVESFEPNVLTSNGQPVSWGQLKSRNARPGGLMARFLRNRAAVRGLRGAPALFPRVRAWFFGD